MVPSILNTGRKPCDRTLRFRLLQHLSRPMPGVGYAIGLFLGLRVAYSLFALLLATVMPLYPPCTAGFVFPAPGTSGVTMAMFDVWRQWDACHYEAIATGGYHYGSALVAFFPLFPALMRILTGLPGSGLMLAGITASGGAYIAAMIGLHRLVARDFDDATARRTVLFLSVFPSAFYLFMPYTEALFLALAVWALYAARHGYWGWAVAGAFLASLTRTQGCMLALPLVWEVIRQRRQIPGAWHWQWWAAGVGLLPSSGLLLFVTYSRLATGWTTFQAQAVTWGASYQLPWVLVWHSWQSITETGSVVEATNLGLLIAFALLFLAGLSRLPHSYSLYVAPQLLLLISRQTSFTPLGSVSRYLLVLFPIFTVLALLLARRRPRMIWLMTSGALLIALCYLFLLGAFVA